MLVLTKTMAYNFVYLYNCATGANLTIFSRFSVKTLFKLCSLLQWRYAYLVHFYDMLCYAFLCCGMESMVCYKISMLCYAMLCYAMLCYAMVYVVKDKHRVTVSLCRRPRYAQSVTYKDTKNDQTRFRCLLY